MTTTIIVLSVTAWILLSAFFLTMACILSARLQQTGIAGDQQSAGVWTPGEGEIPTQPVG